MTISSDVFLAILAMDAYNRGARPSLRISSDVLIGKASILDIVLLEEMDTDVRPWNVTDFE